MSCRNLFNWISLLLSAVGFLHVLIFFFVLFPGDSKDSKLDLNYSDLRKLRL